jgi:hypothetical protein
MTRNDGDSCRKSYAMNEGYRTEASIQSSDHAMHFGGWQECPDAALFQMVYVPHVWLKPGDAAPSRPDCGAPFEKTHEYPSMVGFGASCTSKHDPERSGMRPHALERR